MTTAITDHVIPPPSQANLGQLEVDAFCIGCHYNLHGQIVTLDERLGIPVCRCPECGKFHPAGTGVSSSSIWTRRFATALLFVWVCFIIGFTGVELFAYGCVSASSVGAYTDFRYVTLAGKPLEEKIVNGTYQFVEEGTDNVVTAPRPVFTLRPWNHTDELTELMFFLCTLCVLFGLFAGVVYVTLLWHWPRGRYLFCLLLPLIPGAFLMFIFSRQVRYETIRSQVFTRIAVQTAFQCAGLLLGVLAGRKISRTLIRMLVPPKPRQMLAFLWTIDHKTPPSPKHIVV